MDVALYQRLSEAPDYLLHYIVEHLINARFFDRLHALIDPNFMWAKRIRYGSHRNFVQDLEQIIEALQNERLDGLPRLIFYSMLYSTVRSMATNITPEVLRILGDLGPVEKAVALAETTPDLYQKALAFQVLAGGGQKNKENEESKGVIRKLNRELIYRAYSDAKRMEGGSDNDRFLSSLALDLARIGDREAALACVQQISQEDPYNRSYRTLTGVAVELALAGEASEAFKVYEELEDGYGKTKLLNDLAMALAKAGQTKDALNTVLIIDRDRDAVVQYMARIWPVRWDWLQEKVAAAEVLNSEKRAEHISKVASVIDDIQEEIRSESKGIPDPFETAKITKEKALRLIWLGAYDEALAVLKTIDTNIFWSLTLAIEYEFGVFVKGLLGSGRFEDAEYLIENRWADSYFSEMFPIWREMYSNLYRLHNLGNLDEVFAAIEDIEPKEHQADAMLLIGPQLARSGRIADIVDFCKKNRDDGHFDTLSHQLGTHLVKHGMFDEADLLMGKIIDDSVRYRYTYEVVGSLIHLGRYTEVLPVIKKHSRKISEQLETVAYIAEKLAPEDRSKALELLESGLLDAESVELTFEDTANIFANIAAVLSQRGYIEKAAQVAKHLARERLDLYSEIIGECVANSPDREQAQNLLDGVLDFVETFHEDPEQDSYLPKQTLLNYLVGALAVRSQFEYALTVTSRMVDNFWQKPLAFAELAGRLAAKDSKMAKRILNDAIKLVRKRGRTHGTTSSGYSFLIPNVLPLFFAPPNAQLGKWIMLSPKLGSLGRLVEFEEGTCKPTVHS